MYRNMMKLQQDNLQNAQAKAREPSKLRFNLSYRVAIALKCLSLAKTFQRDA